MRLKSTLFLLMLLSPLTFAEDQLEPKLKTYDHCILHYMKNVGSDFAARKISDSCSALYTINWEDASTVNIKSAQTANNHEKSSNGCPTRSDDGKYCADRVTLTYNLKSQKEDEIYTYRFKPLACKQAIRASSGPNGWYRVESCGFSEENTKFSASIVGWTSPQVFEINIPVEKKKK